MSSMTILLLALALAQNLPTVVPEVATFTSFNANTIQMSIGTSAHCVIWSNLAGAWLTEVACYTTTPATPSAAAATKLEQIQVEADAQRGLYGSFAYEGGSFTWSIVQGAWSFQACPLNGSTLVEQGNF